MTRHDTPESENSREGSIAPIERMIVLALSLPFEIGALVLDSAPTSIEKARQQIVLARFVGKLAVDRGAREIRQRLEGVPETSEIRSSGETLEDTTGILATNYVTAASTPAESEAFPDQESLALPDYDHLPAAHVVAKLPGLSRGERDAIQTYETNRRHRRTILGKLALLSADEDIV